MATRNKAKATCNVRRLRWSGKEMQSKRNTTKAATAVKRKIKNTAGMAIPIATGTESHRRAFWVSGFIKIETKPLRLQKIIARERQCGKPILNAFNSEATPPYFKKPSEGPSRTGKGVARRLPASWRVQHG